MASVAVTREWNGGPIATVQGYPLRLMQSVR